MTQDTTSANWAQSLATHNWLSDVPSCSASRINAVWTDLGSRRITVPFALAVVAAKARFDCLSRS